MKINVLTFDARRAIRVVIAAMLVLTVLAVVPHTPRPAGDVKALVASLFALILAVLIMADAAKPGGTPRSGIVFPMMAGFVAVNAVGGLFSAYPRNSLAETGQLVSYLIFFLAAARAYSTHEQTARVFMTVCAAVGIASAFAFMQRLGLHLPGWSDTAAAGTMSATFGNPNYAGHTLLLTFVLASYLALAERSRAAMAFAALFITHIVLIHHRAAMLAAAVAAAAALTLFAAKHLRTRGRALLCASAMAAVAAAVCAAGLWGRLPLDSSLLLRYNAYYGASAMIADSPLVGYGPGNYVIENARFWTPTEQEHFARQNKLNDHPHCEALYAGVSGGIPGAGFFLGMVASALAGSVIVFWRARTQRARRLGLMFAAFFCAWFIDGLFGFNLKTPASGAIFAVVAGLLDRATTAGKTRRAGSLRLVLPAAMLVVAAFFSLFAVRVFAAAVLVGNARAGIEAGDLAAADKHLGRAERLNPPCWEISYMRAHTFFAARSYAKAVELLEKTLTKNPQYLPAHIDLAKIHVNIAATENPEALDRADSHARAALDICKPLPQALDVLAKTALIRAMAEPDPGRRLEMLALCRAYHTEQLAHGTDKKSEAHTVIGQTYAMAGDLAAAQEAFLAAARFPPHAPDLWASHRQVADRTGCHETYMRALKVGIAYMENEPERFEPLIRQTTRILDDVRAELDQRLNKATTNHLR